MVERNSDAAHTKAAVLIISNDYGFAGFSADTMNEFGKRVFGDLLKAHYDEVIIITAPSRGPENNPVVSSIRQVAQKFDSVDMYVHMHTNMSGGRLAQIPLAAFTENLTAGEKTHLRLLYNMGCADGDPESAAHAFEIGFKTFWSHRGPISASPIFAYPATKAWLEGGRKVIQTSDETFARIGSCTRGLKDRLIANKDALLSAAKAAKECMDNEGAQPFEISSLLACVASKNPMTFATAVSIYGSLNACLPEVTEIATEHGKFLKDAVAKSGTLKNFTINDEGFEMTSMSAEFILEMFLPLGIFMTEPVIYGEDLAFSDRQPDEIAGFEIHEIETGKEEPGFVAEVRDRDLPLEQRFAALASLMRFKTQKYISLLAEIMREPQDDNQRKEYLDLAKRMIILHPGICCKNMKMITFHKELPAELRREALKDYVATIFGPGLSIDEFKMIIDIADRELGNLAFMKSLQDMRWDKKEDRDFAMHLAIANGTPFFHRFAIMLQVIDKKIRDPKDGWSDRYLADEDISLLSYPIIVESEGYASMKSDEIAHSKIIRKMLILSLDGKRPDILRQLCERVVKNAPGSKIARAAKLYLTDRKSGLKRLF